MKIAQVPPLYEAVPPRLYGGTERVVAHLSDALVQLGHDVTLFASADARTTARLEPVRDQAIRLDPAVLKSDLAAHLTQLAEVRERAAEFDVIHFHTDMIHFPIFADMAPRTLTTLHGRLDLKDLPEVYRRWREFPLVSISQAQRAPMPWANWLGTVHHGIAAEAYAFSPKSCGYLAFLGRISPEKRPDRAIAIAKRLGLRLRIAAKVDQQDQTYFDEKIEPLMQHPLVEFVGEIGDSEKSAFLGGADALLFPIDWPEPFGLVMVEAMACGTPVLAFRGGAVEEVLRNGVTGAVVDTVDEAVAALPGVLALDRAACREEFERRFSARRMARDYVRVYERLMETSRRAPAPGWSAGAASHG